MEILRGENITKKYITKKALNEFSVSIEEGKIYGLLGPNGSGKTTFMKIMTGLIQPTSGKITINGERIGVETKKIMAFMPTSNHLPKWMKIKNCIDYFNDFFEDFNRERAEELLKFMELNEKQKVGSLSTGMLQRLKLSLILARDAKVYVLDEPFNGIDPISREKIMEAVLRVCDENKTMIISSHLVKELENILDEVIFVGEGRVVLKGSAEEFRMEKNMSIDELYREVYQNA